MYYLLNRYEILEGIELSEDEEMEGGEEDNNGEDQKEDGEGEEKEEGEEENIEEEEDIEEEEIKERKKKLYKKQKKAQKNYLNEIFGDEQSFKYQYKCDRKSKNQSDPNEKSGYLGRFKKLKQAKNKTEYTWEISKKELKKFYEGLLNEEKDNNGVEFGKYFNTATYNIRNVRRLHRYKDRIDGKKHHKNDPYENQRFRIDLSEIKSNISIDLSQINTDEETDFINNLKNLSSVEKTIEESQRMGNKMDIKAYASAIISLGNELTITSEILKEKIQIELQRKDIEMYREFKDKAFSDPEELYFNK